MAGGPSSRMGENKAELIYHDRPQWAYSAQLISPYCREVYFSLKDENQIPDMDPSLVIIDSDIGDGPISGLLSAFEKFPQAAWLVVGVNMPGVDRALINRIFRQRKPDFRATCLSVHDKLQPLLSIWEPSAAPDLQKYANNGKNSLRKFLETQEVNRIELDSQLAYKLDSVDTHQERQNFLRKGRK